jgi:hypothetical protein
MTTDDEENAGRLVVLAGHELLSSPSLDSSDKVLSMPKVVVLIKTNNNKKR